MIYVIAFFVVCTVVVITLMVTAPQGREIPGQGFVEDKRK